MLQEGEYRARAVKAQLGKSGAGNPQIGVEFELLDFSPQKIGWYGSFTDAAFDITMKGLSTAGFKGSDLSDVSWAGESAPEVVLVVVHETYQEKTRAKVKFINSVGGVNMKDALVGSDAKTFAQRMKGKVLAFQSSAGAPKPQGQAQGRPSNGARRATPASETPLDVLEEQAPSDGDDLPF